MNNQKRHVTRTSRSNQPVPNRRINKKFLVSALISVAAGGGGLFVLYQAEKTTPGEALQQRVQRIQSRPSHRSDLDHFRSYVTTVPSGMKGREALEELLEEKPKSPSSELVTEWEPGARPVQWNAVYQANEKSLRADPQQRQLRRDQVFLAIAFGRFDDARHHIEFLLQESPGDGELTFLLGICDENDHSYEEAVRQYQLAIAQGHTPIPVFARVAGLLQYRLEQKEAADAILDAMVTANPQEHEAWVIRAYSRQQDGRYSEAMQDARQAEELAPRNPDVLLLKANLILSHSESSDDVLTQIRGRIDVGIQEHPQEPRLYWVSSKLALKSGNVDEAIQALRRGLAELPQDAGLNWLLANLLLQKGDVEAARNIVEQLGEMDAPPANLKFLEARLSMEDGDLANARFLLEPLSLGLHNNQSLRIRAAIQLAHCYQLMGDYDRQLAECRHLIKLAPQSNEVLFGMASALASLGRQEESVELLRQVRPTAAAVKQLAQLLSGRNAELLSKPQLRASIEKLLGTVSHADPASVGLLRAAILDSSDRHTEAFELLKRLASQHPNRADVWTSLIHISLRESDWNQSAQFLQTARQQAGDTAELLLAQAVVLLLRDGESHDKDLQALEQDLENLTPNDRNRFLERLADLRFAFGDEQASARIWAILADQNPSHVRAQFHLFRAQLLAGDASAFETTLGRLRNIDGERGAFTMCAEALRAIRFLQVGDEDALSAAQQQLTALMDLRPDWPQAWLARAQFHEIQGDLESAAEQYLRAVQLGFRGPRVVRRTFEMLASAGRYDEAVQLVRSLGMSLPDDVDRASLRMAAEASAGKLQVGQAVAWARKSVAADSRDFRDHVWLGQLLASLGKDDEAERSLRTATRLVPQTDAAWVALTQFLVSTDQHDKAVEVVERAEQILPPDKSAAALAFCFSLVSQHQKAEQYHRTALAAHADRNFVLTNSAAFFLGTNQPEKAEPLLREMIVPERRLPDSLAAWARRSLAAIVAVRDYRGFREGLQLLEQNLEDPTEPLLDQLAQARILAASPMNTDLRKAVELLQALDSRQSLSLDDRLLLAKLCDALALDTQADGHWKAVIEAAPANRAVLLEYVRRSIDRNQTEEAELWLSQLLNIDSNSWEMVELQARTLIAQGGTEAALRLLDKFLEGGNTDSLRRVDRLTAVANLLSQYSHTLPNSGDDYARIVKEADRIHRSLLEESPQSWPLVAQFLAETGRAQKAMRICENVDETEERASALLAETGFETYRMSQLDNTQIAKVEHWIEQAARLDPESAAAVIRLADFRLLRNQLEEAETLYRDVVDVVPDDASVLNNLAWLLAVQKERQTEAAELIARAINVAGPLPELLDTRGTIRMNSGALDEAVADFRQAIRNLDAPLYRFHLAQAYQKAGESTRARDQLRLAYQGGLRAGHLPVREQTAFEELCRQTGSCE